MKIKVIDMLVKMGKDKNYKPTFKYKDTIYQYDFKTKYYTPSFMGLYKIYMILNDEVETIEETKKIEKIDEILRIDDLIPPYGENEYKVWKNIIIQQNKINELVDEINNLKEND
jgi:hypothetical protein